MKNLLCTLLFPVILLGQTIEVQSPVRFLALGDSYTIGQSVPNNKNWPHQLMDSLTARGIAIDTMRIIATTGWRTDHLIQAITNQNLVQQHYNLVSVLIGVNNQYQGKSIEQYQVEFPQLLDSAIRYAGGDTSHVFILSIPDYAATPFGQESNPSSISKAINQYNITNKYFASKYHIKYFDITPISRLGLLHPFLVTNDNLHPSEVQYSEWVCLLLQNNLTAILKDIISKRMTIYPNPAADNLTVSYPVKINKTFELYDSMGKLLVVKEMNDETLDVLIRDLSKGIYITKIVYNGNQVIKKLIKE